MTACTVFIVKSDLYSAISDAIKGFDYSKEYSWYPFHDQLILKIVFCATWEKITSTYFSMIVIYNKKIIVSTKKYWQNDIYKIQWHCK